MQNATLPSIDVSVLGRMEVRRSGELVDLGTPRQRAIMAALALSENRPVAFDAIVERVWGASAPATAVGTMQRYVATLRQAIEPNRATDQPPTVLVTEGAGYSLLVPAGGRDVDRFQALIARARQALSCIADPLRPVAPRDRAEDVVAAVALLDEALGLWRGEPYADLGDHDGQVAAERARLHDLREGALELRLVGLLSLGRHAEVVGDLDSITSLHPLHERWWALRSVALVRCGRQAEALERLGEMRSMLADELGVDPSPPLQELFSDILRQAPSLTWEAPALRPPAASASARRPPQPRPPRPRWGLVGRDSEVDVLTKLLDDHQQHSRSVLITGETGAGKTRLVQELVGLAHDRGIAAATGRCSASAPALWPVRTVLDGIGVRLDVLASGEPHDSSADEFGTWQGVADALQHASRDRALLVVVEDVQWADTATLRLLEHLVADHDLGAITLVITRRTKDGDDPRLSRLAAAIARASGQRLDLGPLSEEDGRRLASTIDPGLVDAAHISRRAGGNPFFITALALAGGEVDGALSDVVRARIACLPPEVRGALQLASSTEGPVDPEMIAELAECPRDDVEAALDAALRAGLLAEDHSVADHYRFEHDVVREVLRTDLPIQLRLRCRQRAERRVATVAHHPTKVLAGPDSRRATHGSPADQWPSIAELMRLPVAAGETRAS